MNFLEKIESLAIQVSEASFRKEKERNTDIIKKRFCLEGEAFYTLEEIGDYYGITRERVRQIEAKSLNNLRKVLSGDELKGGLSASDAVILELEKLKQEIYEQDYILVEKDIVDSLRDKYNIDKSSRYLKVVPLILEVLGYFKLPNKISGYSGEILNCWCLSEELNRKSIEVIFKALKKYRSKAEKIEIFDLVVKEKRDHGEKLNKELLHLILKACPDFQKVDEKRIEVRFESLPSLAEKAYRVLEHCNEPKHYNDILREINFKISKSSVEKIGSDVNLKNQMISDRRFVSIGKSGYWALKGWNSVSTKSIMELMELHLHKENTPQTVSQLFDYVSSKRPGVSMHSIVTYLCDKPQFIRTGDGQYSLSAWGVKSASKPKTVTEDASERIREAVEEVLSTRDIISNSELISSVREKTGISAATIRKAIQCCNELEVVDSSGKSNLLKCNDLRLSSLSTRKPKKLLREKVQEKIVSIMMERSGRKIRKIELYKKVLKEVDCIRPTFYAYLSEMTNIRQYVSNSKYYCEMEVGKSHSSSIAYLDLSPLDSCPAPEIVENVIKATDKLNQKDVDIGLFELGRTFENVLKKYLELCRDNNLFNVYKKDLEKLVSMIACVERNKDAISVKLKQHHLTLLREDRNLRAHGHMPSKQERLVILAKAPFMVEMYIDYIVKFSVLISEAPT